MNICSMSYYWFAIIVAQAVKNTHFSHPFPWKSTSSFVLWMFILNFLYLELFSIARKIRDIECQLFMSNIKASLTIQKWWPMLKYLRTSRQTGQKLYAPDLLMWGHINKASENVVVKGVLSPFPKISFCTPVIFSLLSKLAVNTWPFINFVMGLRVNPFPNDKF